MSDLKETILTIWINYGLITTEAHGTSRVLLREVAMKLHKLLRVWQVDSSGPATSRADGTRIRLGLR